MQVGPLNEAPASNCALFNKTSKTGQGISQQNFAHHETSRFWIWASLTKILDPRLGPLHLLCFTEEVRVCRQESVFFCSMPRSTGRNFPLLGQGLGSNFYCGVRTPLTKFLDPHLAKPKPQQKGIWTRKYSNQRIPDVPGEELCFATYSPRQLFSRDVASLHHDDKGQYTRV